MVRTATFLFAAGQETTARLLAAALKHLAEHPELQDQLRANKDRIPNFIEEALRMESPVKCRLPAGPAQHHVGGVEIKAGTPVMLLNGAANRDPRRFECPARVPGRPAQRPGPHRVRPRRPLVPRRPAGPGRGADQHRAHPRPAARHPPVRGAPRPGRRPPLPLRADLDPARPHLAAPRVRRRPRARREPGRGRHRRGVGHRARRAPSTSPPTATASRSSTGTATAPRRPPPSCASRAGRGRPSRSTSPTGPR